MAELVDALASGASVLRDVEVQVLSSVPNKNRDALSLFLFGGAYRYLSYDCAQAVIYNRIAKH